MTDASFKSAGYALMIEDNPNQKIQSRRKTYAPVAFGSEIFLPAQLKMSIYSKEFLAIFMVFLEFAHILWETTKPTIVFTDNKSVTRFFQTKAIPPSLWNACDYVLQFNFKIAHIAGSVNTAVDFLFTIRIESHEKDPSQNQGRCTNNTHWGHNILFRCCRRRTVFLHAHRWQRWNRRTDPTRERTISGKSSRMGNQPGTILNEAKCQRIHKDRRKHYGVFPSWNKSKCENTSRARCRSSIEELETQNTWPTIWRRVIDNRQKIYTLQSKWGSHYSQGWTPTPEILRRHW